MKMLRSVVALFCILAASTCDAFPIGQHDMSKRILSKQGYPSQREPRQDGYRYQEQPQQAGYPYPREPPQAGYPYPEQSHQAGYPQQPQPPQAGYRQPPQSGYPQQQRPPQARYPQLPQSGYLQQQPPQSGYPQQQQPIPQQQHQQAGYPQPPQVGYPYEKAPQRAEYRYNGQPPQGASIQNTPAVTVDDSDDYALFEEDDENPHKGVAERSINKRAVIVSTYFVIRPQEAVFKYPLRTMREIPEDTYDMLHTQSVIDPSRVPFGRTEIPSVANPNGSPLGREIPSVAHPNGLPFRREIPSVANPNGSPLGREIPSVANPNGSPLGREIPNPNDLQFERGIPPAVRPFGMNPENPSAVMPYEIPQGRKVQLVGNPYEPQDGKIQPAVNFHPMRFVKREILSAANSYEMPSQAKFISDVNQNVMPVGRKDGCPCGMATDGGRHLSRRRRSIEGENLPSNQVPMNAPDSPIGSHEMNEKLPRREIPHIWRHKSPPIRKKRRDHREPGRMTKQQRSSFSKRNGRGSSKGKEGLSETRRVREVDASTTEKAAKWQTANINSTLGTNTSATGTNSSAMDGSSTMAGTGPEASVPNSTPNEDDKISIKVHYTKYHGDKQPHVISNTK